MNGCRRICDVAFLATNRPRFNGRAEEPGYFLDLLHGFICAGNLTE